MKELARPVVALVLLVGALLAAAGQVTALASGQFARWERLEAERLAESVAEDARAGRTDGAGPGVGMGIALGFMCCVPLLFPAAYAGIAVWVLCNPLEGVESLAARVLLHLAWAGWCGGVVLFCLAFGAAGAPWGAVQWEWPGFWLQSAGSWLSAAGHAAAALWPPARD